MTFHQKNQKKFQSIVSCIIFALGFVFLAPRMARAQPVVDAELTQCVVARDTCQKDLASCLDRDKTFTDSYKKLSAKCQQEFNAKPVAPKPAAKLPLAPPKPPKVTLVICEGGATKSANGKYCECSEGVPARLVSDKDVPGVKHAMCVYTVEEVRKIVAEINKKFETTCKPGDAELGRSADLQKSCDQLGDDVKDLILWYRSLVRGKIPLNKDTWNFLYQKVAELEQRLLDLEGRVGLLEDTLCAPFPDDPTASMQERCSCPAIPGKPEATKKERCAPPEKSSAGPFSGGLELEVGGGGFYLHRPKFPTDTPAVAGVVGLTGWVNDTHGVRVRGFAGMGFNSQSQRLFTGAEVAYRLNFDSSKSAGLALGVQGTVEPNNRGNEANNLGGKLGLHLRPAPHFFIEPEIVLGASNAMTYPGGVRTGPSGWGLLVQPGISMGGVF